MRENGQNCAFYSWYGRDLWSQKFALFIVQYEVSALFPIDLEENYDQAGDHKVGVKEF